MCFIKSDSWDYTLQASVAVAGVLASPPEIKAIPFNIDSIGKMSSKQQK